MFENCILDTPVPVPSVAERFKVTFPEFVYGASLFIVIEPVGGVVSKTIDTLTGGWLWFSEASFDVTAKLLVPSDKLTCADHII